MKTLFVFLGATLIGLGVAKYGEVATSEVASAKDLAMNFVNNDPQENPAIRKQKLVLEQEYAEKKTALDDWLRLAKTEKDKVACLSGYAELKNLADKLGKKLFDDPC